MTYNYNRLWKLLIDKRHGKNTNALTGGNQYKYTLLNVKVRTCCNGKPCKDCNHLELWA